MFDAHAALWSVIVSIRKEHKVCINEHGGCPWGNFHEYDSAELLRALSDAGYEILDAASIEGGVG
jgi:hypothetical protein